MTYDPKSRRQTPEERLKDLAKQVDKAKKDSTKK
jgi:hypothetical protein